MASKRLLTKLQGHLADTARSSEPETSSGEEVSSQDKGPTIFKYLGGERFFFRSLKKFQKKKFA